jgi:large subunit ribosomal protein L22
MEVKAHARTQRIAPRKARLVLEQIVGKSLDEAFVVVNNTDKKASTIVFKLLTSCSANAQNNHELDLNNLYVKEAFATDGPTMKRIRPRAQGRASQILKRTSHITVVLAEK